MIYEKEKKYDNESISIYSIIRIIERNKYNMNELNKLTYDLSDSLFICNLLGLYEKIELKVFEYLTNEIKEKMQPSEIRIAKLLKDKILNHFKENEANLLIKKEILIKAIKKYILRYCIGDSKDKNKVLEKLNNNFDNIFNRIDIWGKHIFEDKKFKEESNKLIMINKEGNCIVKYFYGIAFGFESEKDDGKEDISDNSDSEHKKRKDDSDDDKSKEDDDENKSKGDDDDDDDDDDDNKYKKKPSKFMED